MIYYDMMTRTDTVHYAANFDLIHAVMQFNFTLSCTSPSLKVI